MSLHLSARLARSGRLSWLLALLAAGAASAGPVALAPQHAPGMATGGGADARFVQIDPTWRGSTVLWNEDAPEGQRYANGVPGGGYSTIGSFGWGNGIWGRADFDTVMAGGAPVLDSWRGRSGEINFGNGCYNASHAGDWGAAKPVPVADNGPCRPADDDLHGNWIAHFEGYIRITEAGEYNFSVLYDDGFFFRLTGEGGRTLEIGQDFLNARDRLGFDEDLALLPGLYGFELGVWNRLQAGVVDLRMSRDGGDTWTLVPAENLLPTSAVPLPPTALLLAAGLLPILRTRRRRARP